MSFLKDKDGKFSMGRLGGLIVLLMAVAWNVLAMVKYAPLPEGTVGNLTALLGIFAGWTANTKWADKKEES